MGKQHPILFSTEMVKAILEGRKTMTRRIIKSRHESGLFAICRRQSDQQITQIVSLGWNEENVEKDISCPYGEIGDILWVRETFTYGSEMDENGEFNNNRYWYRADEDWKQLEWVRNRDEDNEMVCAEPKWKPSIFMPRIASRITLQITNIKVERLQDISEADAVKEGIDLSKTSGDWEHTPVQEFEKVWTKINGEESWNKNPFIWAIEFKRIKP